MASGDRPGPASVTLNCTAATPSMSRMPTRNSTTRSAGGRSAPSIISADLLVQGTLTSQRDTTGLGDENSVSTDQEMIRLSENQLLYEAAVTMLNKKLSLLKYVTNGGE